MESNKSNNNSLNLIQNFQKISLKQRDIIIYAIGSIGIIPFYYYLSTFLLLYGVSILGLPPLIVGFYFSISQFIYAIALLIFGNISDKIKNNRFGQRKPLMIIGIPFLILCYNWFWNIPPCKVFGVIDFETAIPFFLALVSYRISIACIWAPYYAFMTDLASNEKNQILITSYMYFFLYLGQIIGMILPTFILSQYPFPNSANVDYYWILNNNGIGNQILDQIHEHLFYLYIILIFSVLFVVSSIHLPSNSIYDTEKVKTAKKLHLKQIYNDKNAIRLFCANLIYIIIIGSINYISVNFAIYSLKLGNTLYIFMIFIVIISMLGYFLSNILNSKLGLFRSILICILILSFSLISMIFLFLTNTPLMTQIIACIFYFTACIVAAGISVYMNAFLSRISKEAEKVFKCSIAGSYSGIYNFFGTLGNMIAIIYASAFISLLGSTNMNTYIWIFFVGGIVNFGVFIIFRRINYTKTTQ